jgi:GDPmannose 4,6-dehydratase
MVGGQVGKGFLMINKKKVALISGITGQDGSYLADYLLSVGYKVVGLTRGYKGLFPEHLKHIRDQVTIIKTDYSFASLCEIFSTVQPLEFYNMAAQSYVGKSWLMVDETIEASGMLPINALRAIIDTKVQTRFFQASTSEIYCPASARAIIEGDSISPTTPYGCSKALAHQMVVAYRNNYDIYALNGIFFSHESPRRGRDFLTMKVINGALDIKEGKKKMLKLGNLDVQRDWGDARDYVRAAHLIMQQESPVDYHICSGLLHSVEDIVNFIFLQLGMNYKEYVTSDSSLVRSNEPRVVLGSNSKIRSELGWSATISFEEMLLECIESEKKRRKCNIYG